MIYGKEIIYRIRKKNIFAGKQWDAKIWMKKVCKAAILFLLLNIPFRILMGLFPYSEVRPSNMIPPVLGILWGKAGALGTALANLFVDIGVSKSPIQIWFPGVWINFFYSYLPYKLWYGFGRKSSILPNMKSVEEILRYIIVIFINSLVTTTLILLTFEYTENLTGISQVWFIFFNNFDFAVLLGIPFLVFMGRNRKEISIPANLQKKESNRGNWRDIIPIIISCFGILYYLGYQNITNNLQPKLAGICILIAIILLIIHTGRPFNALQQSEKVVISKKVECIGTRAVMGFLFLSAVFVTFTGILTYALLKNDPNYSELEIWNYVYKIVGISIHVLFAVTLLFLWYVERNITEPLEILTDSVKEFAGKNHLLEHNEEGIKERCKSIQTGDELEILSEAFLKMTEDIKQYVIYLSQVTAEKERVMTELSIATKIQADMLPEELFYSEKREFDIYASMNAAKEVGGDFYDYFMIDAEHLGIVIADVSGKGVPAALFMVIAKTLIQNHARNGESPAEVFEHVNQQLCENNKMGMFVTAWIGYLGLNSGKLTFVNAGHTKPLHYTRTGNYVWFPVSNRNFVLAGMENISYKEEYFQMEQGDALFLYTDGVTEANNKENEMFGSERLLEILNNYSELESNNLLDRIKKEIDDFAGEQEQFDDITMLWVRYRGKERINEMERKS